MVMAVYAINGARDYSSLPDSMQRGPRMQSFGGAMVYLLAPPQGGLRNVEQNQEQA
jgi:hypothetical protein